MDFALTEEQEAIVDLARQILTDRCTQERLREVESGAERFDRDLWNELAKADLLGIALPESVGGGGFGFLEACLILAEAGRAVAPLPLLPTFTAALAIGQHGTDAQREQWLPGVASGEIVLAPALAELDSVDLRDPSTQAKASGDGWELVGAKTAVPAAHLAAALLVPAKTETGIKVFVVEPGAEGVSLGRQDTFNHDPTFHVELDGVRVGADAVLGGPAADGAAILDWLVDRATVGVCAVASGVADAGMRLTAAYASERKQFDRPIGSFQAVGHRMADCYVDNEAIRLTMLYAASLLGDQGESTGNAAQHSGPAGGVEAGSAEQALATPAESAQVSMAVATAKYWASYGGSRIAHAGLHVHGGISIDLDYPIHRYFLTAKQLEFTLGPGAQQIASLGAALATEPVAG